MWVVLDILLCLFIWRGLLSCNKHVMWSGSEASDPLSWMPCEVVEKLLYLHTPRHKILESRLHNHWQSLPS